MPALLNDWVPTEFRDLLVDVWFFIPNWQWLVLIGASLLSLILRPFLQFGLKKLKKKSPWRKEDGSFLGFFREEPSEGAASWIVVGLIWLLILDLMQLPAPMDRALTLFTKVVLAVHLIRFVYLAVDALGEVFRSKASKTETSLDDQLAPFATKSLKILVVVLGVLLALQNFGFNVVGLLAGLGLGGLALALAAQDTAANLFGSVTILLDAPFKVGDWIKIGDTEGIVEEVGFRSTRIRTFYNSLVTLPNSVVAKERIDNMGVRTARRVRQVLGIQYDTPPERVAEFVDAIRYGLLQEPQIDRERVSVTFVGFNASSLDILVNFHLLGINSIAEEHALTQKMYLEFLKIAKEHGVSFAFPTQTLFVEKFPLPPSPL